MMVDVTIKFFHLEVCFRSYLTPYCSSRKHRPYVRLRYHTSSATFRALKSAHTGDLFNLTLGSTLSTSNQLEAQIKGIESPPGTQIFHQIDPPQPPSRRRGH